MSPRSLPSAPTAPPSARTDGPSLASTPSALIATILALAFLAATAWLFRETARGADQVAHTLEVKTATDQLLNIMLNAETGQRGYLLTGDRAYLQPYERARQDYAAHIKALSGLVADNPAQQQRLASAQDLAQERFAIMAETVEASDAGRRAQAIDMVKSGRGKAVMDLLRADLAEVATVEDALLAERRKASQRWRYVSLLPIILSSLALGVLGWREYRRQKSQTADLRVYSDTLNKLVAERTSELERERGRVEALLRDVTHRVGNNLAMIVALLNIQRRRIDDARVKEALEEVSSRIQAMAAGQRRLVLDIETDEVAARPYIENLLDELRNAARERNVTISSDIAETPLPGRDAVSYIILVNELVTNALKHAFSEGEPGHIFVRLSEETTERGPAIRIVVEDDGVGVGAEQADSGLGQKVMRSLLVSLGGEVTREPANPGAARPGLRSILIAPRRAG